MMGSRFPTIAHARANGLLGEMGELSRDLAQIEAEMEAKLEAVRDDYRLQIVSLKNRLKISEADLLKLEKAHKGELFTGESCRVDLPHGALLYNVSRYVKKAKAVTWERLEELGYLDGVKVVKSVDWDALAAWPEERLIACGTERVKKEEFAYEVKG